MTSISSKSVPMGGAGVPRPVLAPFQPAWLEPCRRLLEGLPEWFGSSAVAGYAADLGRFPSWVASLPAGSAVAGSAVAGSAVAGSPASSSVAAGNAVGCVSVTAPQSAAFEVHLLAVAREHHRHGVGSLLLEVAERWARHCGARYLQVKTTGPSSPDPVFASTRAFYEARGFTPLFESDRLWGPENPALVLVKSL
jgi:ribosomal protein S18 acetylase RimI-like enzyme